MPVKSKMVNPLSDGNEHLRDFEEQIERHVIRPAEEIVTAKRFVEVGKKKFEIVRKDPYGFWNVLPQGKTPLPVELSGKWTTAKDCQRAIEWYVNTKLPELESKRAEASAVA